MPDEETEVDKALGKIVSDHPLPWHLISSGPWVLIADDGTKIFRSDKRDEADTILNIARSITFKRKLASKKRLAAIAS